MGFMRKDHEGCDTTSGKFAFIDEKRKSAMQTAWDESRMALCYCSCFPPTSLLVALHFCGNRKRKENVYDRTSRVVSANVQREDEMRLLPRFADADNLPTSSSMK
jgi:hypothetical protein